MLGYEETEEEIFLDFMPNTVLLTVCNTGYILLTQNLIMSLERLNLGKYLIVASTEPTALDFLGEMSEFSGSLLTLGNESASGLAKWWYHDKFKERASVTKLKA